MPIITKIIQQQKQNDRYSVYIDGNYCFSLGEASLMRARLEVGANVDERGLEIILNLAQCDKALDCAYGFLSYRPRSTKEVRDYLKNKGYSLETIESVNRQLLDKGYIDDLRFARLWVQERQASKPRSLLVLRDELAQKGISRETVDEVLCHISTEDQVAAIVVIIKAKRLQQRYDQSEHLIRYLAGQGFAFSDIKKALRELSED